MYFKKMPPFFEGFLAKTMQNCHFFSVNLVYNLAPIGVATLE